MGAAQFRGTRRRPLAGRRRVLDYGRRLLGGGVGCGAGAGGAVGCVSIGSGVLCAAPAGCWPCPSSTERSCEPDCEMNDSTSARNRKIPAVHHVSLVSSVVAWRPPMTVSVPAPPPRPASPPPCPAWSSTAVARISESRMRIPTRIPYMRGARYLGYGRAHKLRPASGLERCATDQHAVQLVFGEQLGDVFQTDRAAVEDHEGRGGDGVVGQPSANRPVDFGGVLWRRIASGTDRPDGLVGDGDPRLAVAFPERRLEPPRDDLQRVARLTLLERLADAEDRLQVRGERRGNLLARLLVRFTKDMT